MGDTVFQGFWDCSNCTKTRIPGSYKQCPSCNDPQNSVLSPSEDWYLPEDAPVITDIDELRKASKPAWNCGHCGVLNDGDVKACSGCNRPLDFDDTVSRTVKYDDLAGETDVRPHPLDEMFESDLTKAQRMVDTEGEGPRIMPDLTLPADQLPTIGTDTAWIEEERRKADARFNRRSYVKTLPSFVQTLYPHRKQIAIAVAVAVIVLAITGIVRMVQYYTATEPGTVTVSALQWERQVEVEEYKTLAEEGWSHPADARVSGSETRIRSYRTVHDGWRTESYIDYETRYRTEQYIGSQTLYRSESYSYDCSYTQSNGNGTFTRVSRSCSGIQQVPYQVSVPMTRQVPYQVEVPKTRQVEITHQEPVFDDWYVYQIDRWVTDRWVTASDASSPTVIWPEPDDLSFDSQPGDQVGEERVGDERTQRYTIIYIDQLGATHSERSEDDRVWRELTQGEAIPARYYQHDGRLASVEW